MPLPCFYVAPENLQHNLVTLSEETSKHVVQVLRMQENEKIKLTDGLGFFYEATIQNANRKKCVVSWQEKIEQPAPDFKVRIAISLIKNNSRFEWFLEKATEIGVTEIIPIICERTEKQKAKQERMQSILISAMLQSQQAWLPKMEEPISFKKLLTLNNNSQKFIACCDERFETLTLTQLPEYKEDCLVLIGPEGDFTKDEIEMAVAQGYQPVSLGSTRLRTETAGIIAAVQLQSKTC